MLAFARTRWRLVALIFLFNLILLRWSSSLPFRRTSVIVPSEQVLQSDSSENASLPYLADSDLHRLPKGTPKRLPNIQYRFGGFSLWSSVFESNKDKIDPALARKRVKETFLRSWQAYKTEAWGHDQVAPIFGGYRDASSSRAAATLIGALDTLWIMDLRDDFNEAVEEIRNFPFSSEILLDMPLADIAGQILGGLLGAYDISTQRHPILLEQAHKVGCLLLEAFNTTNGMPTKYAGILKDADEASYSPVEMAVTELSSMTLEFTRLSQLTGDARFFNAVSKIADAFEEWQSRTSLPGLWPDLVDAADCSEEVGTEGTCHKAVLQSSAHTSEDVYSLGSGTGSVYSNFLKQHLLLGQQDVRFKRLYNEATGTIKNKLAFYPLAGNAPSMQMVGNVIVDKTIGKDGTIFEAHVSRSTCSSAAMFALGARSLKETRDMGFAKRLARGCVWGHENSRSGVMPAEFMMMKCTSMWSCGWDMHSWWNMLDIRLHDSFDPELYIPPQVDFSFGGKKGGKRRRRQSQTSSSSTSSRYDELQSQTVSRPQPMLAHEDFVRDRVHNEGLAEGMLDILSREYDLQSETIESIFTLYRITGDYQWREKGWRVFESIDSMTATRLGNARLLDTTKQRHDRMLQDIMQSWWLAATLKYFYLLFSAPGLVSLDDFIFNSEGHPFRLPK